MIRAAAVLALLPWCAADLAGQTPQPFEPTLVFSIKAGLSTGSDLWTILRQPQAAPNNNFDTLAISRVLRPGLVAGLAATYFTSPNFGISAEATYFGIASEQRCRGPLVYQPDSLNINAQLCTRANGQHINTSVVGFLVGGTWRMSKAVRVQPFVRATVGPGLIGNSYVETTGIVLAPGGCGSGCVLAILDEQKTPQLTFMANLSAGLTYYLSPAYRVRIEAHDVITSLPVATGPHTPTSSFGTTGRVVKHAPTFTFGLDLSLERRRTRRY